MAETFRPSGENFVNEEKPTFYPGVGEIQEEFFRSGGKGGQNVNKVETGVRLRAAIVDPELLQRLRERSPRYVTEKGELIVVATRERSRKQNQDKARKRFEEILAEAQEEPKERIPTKTPISGKEDRLREKQRRGALKHLRQRPEVE